MRRRSIERYKDLGIHRTAGTKDLAPLTRCAAARDGDCTHPQCPQLGDNEPSATGRHCPLDTEEEQ